MEKEKKNNQSEGPMSVGADVTSKEKSPAKDGAEKKNAGKNVATTANSKPVKEEGEVSSSAGSDKV